MYQCDMYYQLQGSRIKSKPCSTNSSIRDILLCLTGFLTVPPQSVGWSEVAQGSESFLMQRMRQRYRSNHSRTGSPGRKRICRTHSPPAPPRPMIFEKLVSCCRTCRTCCFEPRPLLCLLVHKLTRRPPTQYCTTHVRA